MPDTAVVARTRKLRNGAEITLREMDANDATAMLAFAKSLPNEDVLFLRSDITTPEGIAYWVANLENGTTTSLVAVAAGTIVGYASLHRNPARWTRRVGEIRVNIAHGFRAQGLGRLLVNAIFDRARSLGLRKLSANMTVDQPGARAVFRRLGFQVEAILADWVEDSDGNPRDLLIMAYDLDGLTDMVDDPARL